MNAEVCGVLYYVRLHRNYNRINAAGYSMNTKVM